jgi:hypothetical protein
MTTHKPMNRTQYAEYIEQMEVPDFFDFETAYDEYVQSWKEARSDERI